MNYEELLAELRALADEKYRDFHKKLLADDNIVVLGVRVPALRRLAGYFRGREDELLSWPDSCYEIKFIKLAAVAAMPYEQFVVRLENCVSLMDCWALCDCFSPKCIRRNRRSFIPYIQKYLSDERPFAVRFAITALLSFYVEEQYLDLIFDCCARADTSHYYVHMAVAWLVAEVLVKHYDRGVAFLKQEFLTVRTHNKAICKAKESYRLAPEQKIYLNNLKR